MRKHSAFLSLAVAAACADPTSSTAPLLPTDAVFGKPWAGTYAAVATGIQAAAFPANNDAKGQDLLNVFNVGDYLAGIDLSATAAAGTGGCIATNSRVPASRLRQLLNDAAKPRSTFQTRITALGTVAGIIVRLAWVDPVSSPDTAFHLSVGSNDTYPNEFATVTQIAPNVYRFSGGRVSMRMNYDHSRFTGLNCPNFDTIDVTFPAPAP